MSISVETVQPCAEPEGGKAADCGPHVMDDAAPDGMASVPAMLAFLTQQPQDGEPATPRSQMQPEAAPEPSAGSMTGSVLCITMNALVAQCGVMHCIVRCHC